MPQYVRENGGIRVIPDDNTTEDGEIDLSPTRKIIDEGNIVLEGRDDGSTVIRERRFSDHKFIDEASFQAIEQVPFEGFVKNIKYIAEIGVFVLVSSGSGPSILVDEETLQTQQNLEDVNNNIRDTIAFSPTTTELYSLGGSGYMTYNNSTGFFEGELTVSTLPEENFESSFYASQINKIVGMSSNGIQLVDPETKNVTSISSVDFDGYSHTSGITSDGQFLSYGNDQDIYVVNLYEETVQKIQNFKSRAIAGIVYNPFEKEYILADSENEKLVKIDPFSLQVKKEKEVSRFIELAFFGTPMTLTSDQKIIRILPKDRNEEISGFIQIIEPKTLDVLEEVAVQAENIKNADGITAFGSLAYIPKTQKVIIGTQVDAGGGGSSPFVFEYNPFG